MNISLTEELLGSLFVLAIAAILAYLSDTHFDD